ncbi:MAG TPA: hypothetical protein VGE67_04890 [Haloferula sp.]
MAGYIPRTGARKKRDILGKRLSGLEGACARGESAERVSQAIGRVRDAQLGVLKCQLYELEGRGSKIRTESALRTKDEEIAWWEEASDAEVVRFFAGEVPSAGTLTWL